MLMKQLSSEKGTLLTSRPLNLKNNDSIDSMSHSWYNAMLHLMVTLRPFANWLTYLRLFTTSSNKESILNLVSEAITYFVEPDVLQKCGIEQSFDQTKS